MDEQYDIAIALLPGRWALGRRREIEQRGHMCVSDY